MNRRRIREEELREDHDTTGEGADGEGNSNDKQAKERQVLYDQYPDLLVVDSNDELANLVYHLCFTVPEKLSEKLVSNPFHRILFREIVF